MLKGLHHIAILASDRAETLAFYEALGFVVTENHVRPERKDEIIFMEQAGVVLELFISAGNPPRVSFPEAYGLVNNGKIVAEVEPGMATETILHDLNGSFELVIAGESADFTFYMDGWFCEQYNITVGD